MFRKKVYAHILVEFGDTFQEIKTLKIPIEKDKFEFKEHTFAIDLTKSIFDKKMNPHLFFRLGQTIPLTFNNNNSKEYNSKLLTSIIKSDVWRKMLNTSIDKYMLLLIIALAIGIVITACVGFYFLSAKAATVAPTISNSTQITPIP